MSSSLKLKRNSEKRITQTPICVLSSSLGIEHTYRNSTIAIRI